MVQGRLIFDQFTYEFAQATIQVPGGGPEQATILKVDSNQGVMAEFVFRPEDLAVLKGIVEKLEAPSSIVQAPAAALATLPRMDIPRGRRG